MTNSSNNDSRVKDHINNMVNNYDKLILKLIPEYKDMQQCIIDSINCKSDDTPVIIDLGIGTGNLAYDILNRYPNSRLIGIDLSPEMIEIATDRLSSFSSKTEFILGNMSKIDLPSRTDTIVSTLAIHHLTNNEKRKLFARIYKALKTNGTFIVGDLVTFRNYEKAVRKENEWRQFIFDNLGPKEGQFRFDEYKKGDIPAPLEDLVDWLRTCGFREINKKWELLNYAVISAKKVNYIFSGEETPKRSRVFFSTILVAKISTNREFFDSSFSSEIIGQFS